mmetsp:Transcript_64084/g.143236  ORF Transcript_64084/g.143236 Transcript_64084/m.143236 type:complete len:249 (+) Transcript_64084:6-752(+)
MAPVVALEDAPSADFLEIFFESCAWLRKAKSLKKVAGRAQAEGYSFVRARKSLRYQAPKSPTISLHLGKSRAARARKPKPYSSTQKIRILSETMQKTKTPKMTYSKHMGVCEGVTDGRNGDMHPTESLCGRSERAGRGRARRPNVGRHREHNGTFGGPTPTGWEDAEKIEVTKRKSLRGEVRAGKMTRIRSAYAKLIRDETRQPTAVTDWLHWYTDVSTSGGVIRESVEVEKRLHQEEIGWNCIAIRH